MGKKYDKMLVVSFIDVDTWNIAGWQGTVYAVDPSGQDMPALGLLFTDEPAGRKIFTDLIDRLSNQDEHELLRVSIIEGEVPGKEPGYSVYLGTDYENYSAQLKRAGEDVTNLLSVMVGRHHRMTPAPGSPFLPGFKKAYEKHQRYLLFPAFGRPSNPRPEFALAIGKRKLNFLRAESLSKNDSEYVVLMKDGESFKRDG